MLRVDWFNGHPLALVALARYNPRVFVGVLTTRTDHSTIVISSITMAFVGIACSNAQAHTFTRVNSVVACLRPTRRPTANMNIAVDAASLASVIISNATIGDA